MAVTKEEYLKAYHEILAKCNSGELMKMSRDERLDTWATFGNLWHEYVNSLPDVPPEKVFSDPFGKEVSIGGLIANARHYMEVNNDGYYYPLDVLWTHPEKIYDGTFKPVKYEDTGRHSL